MQRAYLIGLYNVALVCCINSHTEVIEASFSPKKQVCSDSFTWQWTVCNEIKFPSMYELESMDILHEYIRPTSTLP